MGWGYTLHGCETERAPGSESAREGGGGQSRSLTHARLLYPPRTERVALSRACVRAPHDSRLCVCLLRCGVERARGEPLSVFLCAD